MLPLYQSGKIKYYLSWDKRQFGLLARVNAVQVNTVINFFLCEFGQIESKLESFKILSQLLIYNFLYVVNDIISPMIDKHKTES